MHSTVGLYIITFTVYTLHFRVKHRCTQTMEKPNGNIQWQKKLLSVNLYAFFEGIRTNSPTVI